jgi:methylated-DNA-protein-cysteine methyltransferase-like protein
LVHKRITLTPQALVHSSEHLEQDNFSHQGHWDQASATQASFSPKQKIWLVVSLIPEGKVLTYGKVADLAGLPGRARYVSKALKEAPDTLNLAWYRVLNSQGKISFDKYSPLFQHQQASLRAEGVLITAGKLKLSEFEWRPEMATLVMSLPF